LFKKAAIELPAYQKFLKEKGCNPNYIRTVADFVRIPVTSKKTYLQQNDRRNLVWAEDLKGPLAFCSTSGSTGEPYYFPRNDRLAQQASVMAEDFLKQSSYGEGRTLVLMGLGMGVWIGGLITLRAFEIAAERMQAPVAFLAPGYNKKEIFKALKKLAPEFDQTILVGYPPFIKELLDEVEDENIDIGKLHIRLMFAAEAFTETFRNYVTQKAKVQDPLLDTLNIYGTADIGAMAHETPLSILVRRLVLEDPLLYKDTFGQIEKTPTLAQYRPEFIEFEEVNGELLLTGNAALPLIRYAVGDNGGVHSYDQIQRLLHQYGVNLEKEIDEAGIRHTVQKLPFVFVYERTDLSTMLHGIIIYPEFIKEGLLKPKLTPLFTEKFTMSTKHDIHHNQFLQINLELRKGIEPNQELELQAQEIVRETLIEKSSEFSEISKSRASENLLKIILWPHEHPRYFAPNTKQRWVETGPSPRSSEP
jgi:phenylacetate-CoA ligase